MKLSVKMPETTGIRRSVEVQQGTRGAGKMLRRGLHGSKNWILERDEDGGHRSVWSKAFRVFVVLMPVWIVMSAVTGGPERGGHSAGAFQSVLISVLVLLVGLAVFSARERRLGNEEPWQEAAEDGPTLTESDEAEAETLVVASPEGATQILENPQVTEVAVEREEPSPILNSGKKEDSEHFDSPEQGESQHQAILENATPLAPEGLEAAATQPDAVLQQATFQADPPSNTADSGEEADLDVPDFLRKTSGEVDFPQVGGHVEDLDVVTFQASDIPTNEDGPDVTESNASLLADEPTTPLRAPLKRPLDQAPAAIESVQVSLVKESVQQPLQGVLQVQFAAPGPYPAKEEPVHESWWAVAPDVEPEPEGETASDAPVGTAVEVPQAEFAAVSQEVSVQPQETAPAGPVRRHPVVLMYFASQAPKSSLTAEEKAQARTDLIGWLRGEVSSGRMNRAEASRMVGVDPSTVTRWLSDDPWAG